MATNGNYNNDDTAADRNVEMWKIKKLIKSLEQARGYGDEYVVSNANCYFYFAGKLN